jgi:hypothetical protein
MTDASGHLAHIASLEEVAWGIVLIAITMMVHAVGMLLTVSVASAHLPSRGQFWNGLRVLVLASWTIVFVHLVEVAIWAAFFVACAAMPSASAAYYYALLQYTTVGSDLVLPDRWELLGGMISIAGLLTFAWSTTVLLTVAQPFQDAELSRIGRKKPPPDTP